MDVKENRLRQILYALIILGAVVRILICFYHNPLDYLFSDPKRHWLNGARLFHPDLMGASDPILYQVYVCLLRLVTGDNRILIALSAGLLSVLMPWTYYRAGRAMGLSRDAALWVWLLISWMPSLLDIYHYIMMETLLLPLVGISIWMSGRALRKGTFSSWLWMVVFWSLCCLTKPTVVPLVGVAGLYVWWNSCRTWKTLVAGMFLGILFLIPNTIRTDHYLGFPSPLGNPWITMIQHRSGAKVIHIYFGKGYWEFSSPSCYIQPLEPLSTWMIKRSHGDSTMTVTVDPANGKKDWVEKFNSLRTTFPEWCNQLKENMIIFLFAPSWPDVRLSEWSGFFAYHGRWLWAPLILFVLGSNFLGFWGKQFHLLPLMVTALTFFLLFQNIAPTEGRYRKPLEPLLLLNLIWVVTPMTPQKEMK